MTKETISAVHQILREELFAQLRNAANIDAKISIVAGFNALVLVLSWQIYPNVQAGLFFAGIILLFASLYLLFKAYRTEDWLLSPSPQTLVKEINEGKEIEDIYRRTIGDIGGVSATSDTHADGSNLGIYRLNKKKIDRKARLLNVCTYILFSGLLLVGLSRVFF